MEGEIRRDAEISSCGRYRYALTRYWSYGSVVVFVMLNPSTADGNEDDPTIRRCISFAQDWGCGGLVVVNLFALRATDPKKLYTAVDPIGPLNNDTIRNFSKAASLVVLAWGAHGKLRARGSQVRRIIQEQRNGDGVFCLGKTRAGEPQHPLYLPKSSILIGE